MIQFKEITFIKMKPVKGVEVHHLLKQIEDIRVALRKQMDWSISTDINFHYDRSEIYMNYENKAIYNNGIVIHKLQNGQFEVEIVTSIPRENCSITNNTSFKQGKNFINYTYERSIFYSNPINLFQSMGYKIQNKFEYKEVEYFKSLTFGLEVIIYPKNGYIQIIQNYVNSPDIDYSQSAANQILPTLSIFLNPSHQVILSSGNMKPHDFLQEY